MMKKYLAIASILMLGLGAGLAAAATIDYEAELRGSNEVPPVSSEMDGTLTAKYDAAQQKMTIRLRVDEGQDITMAHLHCGAPGVNGPPIVTLYENPTGADGQLIVDTTITSIGAAGLACSPAIATVADLNAAMAAGKIYANVHTIGHATGEIRGQVMIEGTGGPGPGPGTTTPPGTSTPGLPPRGGSFGDLTEFFHQLWLQINIRLHDRF